MRWNSTRPLASVVLGSLISLSLCALQAQDVPRPIKVKWTDDWHGMEFTFLGEKCRWPEDVVKGKFPPPSTGPVFKTTQEWPLVALHARWSLPLKNMPKKYRSEVRDLAFMYTCDAQLYEYLYPQVVLSSGYRCPGEFIANANDPLGFDLAEALRGKLVAYKITASAGFGAPNYTIQTNMRLGMSRDGKTVFFHDKPEYITANLTVRDYLVAFHVTDDELRFEGRMYCICTDRYFFRGEHMRRVALSGQYLIERLHADLTDVNTPDDVEEYLDLVKNKYVRIEEVAARRKDDETKVLP